MDSANISLLFPIGLPCKRKQTTYFSHQSTTIEINLCCSKFISNSFDVWVSENRVLERNHENLQRAKSMYRYNLWRPFSNLSASSVASSSVPAKQIHRSTQFDTMMNKPKSDSEAKTANNGDGITSTIPARNSLGHDNYAYLQYMAILWDSLFEIDDAAYFIRKRLEELEDVMKASLRGTKPPFSASGSTTSSTIPFLVPTTAPAVCISTPIETNSAPAAAVPMKVSEPSTPVVIDVNKMQTESHETELSNSIVHTDRYSFSPRLKASEMEKGKDISITGNNVMSNSMSGNAMAGDNNAKQQHTHKSSINADFPDPSGNMMQNNVDIDIQSGIQSLNLNQVQQQQVKTHLFPSKSSRLFDFRKKLKCSFLLFYRI